MKTIGAAKFKEQCLALLDRIDPEGIVITKRGKPVARLVPIKRSGKDLIGCMKGRLHVKGNIFGTGIRWRASAES